MMECEYFSRHFVHVDSDNKVMVETCTLTGRACFLDPPGQGPHCLRRQLALEYQAKHSSIDPTKSQETAQSGMSP